jgi:transposase
MDAKQADSLTPRQSRVISILVQTRTMEEGAKLAGVSKTSIYSWLRKPLFREELTRRKNEVMDVALENLKSHVEKAVSVLATLLDSDSEEYDAMWPTISSHTH